MPPYTLFSYLIGVLTSKFHHNILKIMVGVNWKKASQNHNHPQVAGRPFHIGLERKQAWAGLELTATVLVKDSGGHCCELER